MKRCEWMRYAVLMLLGMVLNYLLYGLAHILHLPMWIDCVGTAWVAVVLEPAAGLIVAFATNFLQSAALFGPSSILYYFVGASAALSFGILLRKNRRICWRRLPLAGVSYLVFGSLLSWGVTLWRTGGALSTDSGWENHFARMAVEAGAPDALGILVGIAVLKAADVAVMLAVVPLLTALTPRALRTEVLDDPVSLHESFSFSMRAK